MVPKCSLTGYNPFLQLLGLLFLAFILVIVVIYYLQVYHTRIVEKYTGAASSGAIDNTTEPVPVDVVTPEPPEATANVDDKPAAVPEVF